MADPALITSAQEVVSNCKSVWNANQEIVNNLFFSISTQTSAISSFASKGCLPITTKLVNADASLFTLVDTTLKNDGSRSLVVASGAIIGTYRFNVTQTDIYG